MARLMLCASLGLGLSASGRMQPSSGALAPARLLATQLPSRQNATTVGGEHDEHEWWLEHGELLQQARREFGPLHPALYEFEAHVDEFLHPDLLEAIEGLERAAAAGSPIDERALRALLHPSGAPNVWRLPCFTAKFCEMLLEELRHYEASGVPLRRPNGMNRYGAILDALGLGQSLTYLARRFLRPIAQLLYPWLIARGDADEQYAFIVRCTTPPVPLRHAAPPMPSTRMRRSPSTRPAASCHACACRSAWRGRGARRARRRLRANAECSPGLPGISWRCDRLPRHALGR